MNMQPPKVTGKIPPIKKSSKRVMWTDLETLTKVVNSAIEGLTNRVMSDRKRNEELIELRTSTHQNSKAMQQWKAQLTQTVADLNVMIGKVLAEWEKFRQESASNHAARVKVYEEHEERIQHLEGARIASSLNISLALQRLHLIRDAARRWENQPVKSMAEDAIRALGGTV